MPTFPQMQLPPPKNWQEFEDICLDLFKNIWGDQYAQRHGKGGSGQNGVDIYGKHLEKSSGVQCKGKEIWPPKQLTKAEINSEVEKAKGFKPKLDVFVIATIASRISSIQEHVRLLSEEHKKNGLFEVRVFGWEDILENLTGHHDIIKKHYPQIFQTSNSEEVREVKSDTEEILSSQERIESELSEIKKNTLAYTAPPIETDYSSLNDDIDYSKELIEKGKPESALEYLLDLKKKKWDKAGNNEKFRILTNIGSAKMNMNLFDEAAEQFIEAYKYKEDDIKSLSNLSLAYSLKNDKVRAIEYAKEVLKIDPDNHQAYMILIHKTGDSFEDILKWVPNKLQSEPKIANALGHKLLEKSEPVNAMKYFEAAVENDTKNIPDFKADLATSKINYMHKEKSLVIDKEKIANEAIKLLESAINEIKNSERAKYKYSWFENLGIAKSIAADEEGAIVDFNQALKYKPEDPGIIRNLAFTEFNKNPNRAIELMEKIKDTKEMPEIKIILADFLRIEERFDEAEEVINEFLSDSPDTQLQKDAYRILEVIYNSRDGVPAAKKISKIRKEKFPDDVVVMIDSAKLDKESGNDELAIKKLKDAIEYTNSSTSNYVNRVLANELYSCNLFSEAYVIFERFVNKKYDSPEARKLLNCYYKTGKWDDALELCKALRKLNPEDAGLTELESHIYGELGDLPKAKSVYEDFLKLNESAQIKLSYAVLNYRAENYDDLDNILNSRININELGLEDRIELAKLYSLRDKKQKLLDLAYETRREFFDQSDAHSSYVWLLLERNNKDAEFFKVTEAGVNTVVFLKNNGETKFYIMEDRKKPDLSKNEINPDHSIFKKLNGKKKGDEIILAESPLNPDTWTIDNIKSKYLHALYVSMSSFNELFPEAESFRQIKVNPSANKKDELMKMLDFLTKDGEKLKKNYTEILKYYKQGKVTIGMIAYHFHRSPIEIWSNFIFDENAGILSSAGSKEENNNASMHFSNNEWIIIDLISLCTIAVLKLEDSLFDNMKLGVCQQNIDEIKMLLEQKEGFSSLGYMTVMKENKKYSREEITEEQVDDNKKFLKKMLEFISKKCEVIPLDPKAMEKISKYKDMTDFMGKSFLYSILLAKQTNGILLSDDYTLRAFAKGEFQVNGIWTQLLLHRLNLLNVLGTEEYNKLIVELVSLNYFHTSINSNILIEAARQSEWLPGFPLTHTLKILDGGKSDESSAIFVAVNFVFDIWNELITNEKRDDLICCVLDSISRDRNLDIVINKFLTALGIKFKLLPLDLHEIMQLITAWKKTKLL